MSEVKFCCENDKDHLFEYSHYLLKEKSIGYVYKCKKCLRNIQRVRRPRIPVALTPWETKDSYIMEARNGEN